MAEKSHRTEKIKRKRSVNSFTMSILNETWPGFFIHSFLTVTTTLVTGCSVVIPFYVFLYILKGCRVVLCQHLIVHTRYIYQTN